MARLTEDQKILIKNVTASMRAVMANGLHVHNIKMESDKSIKIDVRDYPAAFNPWDGTTAP